MLKRLIFQTSRRFSAAHRISCHQGKCSNLHGHTWKVDIRVIAEVTEEYAGEIVLDFGTVKAEVDKLDHQYLNEYLEEDNVTAEFLAIYFSKIFTDLVKSHNQGNSNVSILEVIITVWESEDSFIEMSSK